MVIHYNFLEGYIQEKLGGEKVEKFIHDLEIFVKKIEELGLQNQDGLIADFTRNYKDISTVEQEDIAIELKVVYSEGNVKLEATSGAHNIIASVKGFGVNEKESVFDIQLIK